MLETILYSVNQKIPKEEFRKVDNTPKHLLHMTEDDMKPKPPEVLRDELNELIKEAKSKIKPVLMSPALFDQLVKSKEDFIRENDEWHLVNIDPKGTILLDKENISLEVLRKIQDKKFEIDLQYEKTRDLFEKQRVIDPFLVEHEEDNLVMHGYYQNKYSQANMNKYLKFIYNNSYDLKKVRFNLWASTFSTVVATAALALVNPYLCAVMLYDYYLLAAFSNQIVNRTVFEMILHNNKTHIILNKLNFLGYQTEKKHIVMIRNIKYTGELKNEYLNFDFTGLPPSISKLMSLSTSYMQTDSTTGDAKSESITEKDTFKHFVSFMANNETFVIPMDNENFKKSVIAEELMNHIIHGRQKGVMQYDYSALEAEGERLDSNLQEVLEMYDE